MTKAEIWIAAAILVVASFATGTLLGVEQRRQECHASFDALQAYGVLLNPQYDLDYVQVLLCDGENAGEQ